MQFTPVTFYNVAVMKKAVGKRLRPVAFLGIFIFIILLKVNVVKASETIPVDSYFNSLEGSIFASVTDAGYLTDTPPYVTEKVAFYVDFFTTTGRTVFQQWLDQAGPYIPLIREILHEEGLPEDLALLPLIESGFNVNARSPATATGMWQFMASTGALYGLKINKWVDERKDPIKSTRAAARHLKDLYTDFGTWPLALASYNAGSGKVKRALASTGSSTFWDMGRSRALKAETRNYIPKFMAAMIIAKNPDFFGFTFSEEPVIKYDALEVPGGMDLHSIAKNAKISYDSLRELNPELKSHITPFGEPYYTLRLPEGAGTTFLENYDKLPFSQRIVYRDYKVKKGDTVYGIARRNGTDVSLIKEVNNFDRRYKIFPGDVILIPIRVPFGEGEVRLVTSADIHPEDTL